MNRLALLFAGQGSQFTGMAIDFIDSFPSLQLLIVQADTTLGYSIRTLLNANDGSLNQTQFTQPAIHVASGLMFHSLMESQPFQYHACTGFSLGEYTALHASGVLTWSDSLKLLKTRAEAMQYAAQLHPGQMAAVLGLSHSELQPICQQCQLDGFVASIANLNCPGQLVISGTVEGIRELSTRALAAGARRVIPLNVSGGFHSILMQPAVPLLTTELATLHRQTPVVPVYMNVTAAPLYLPALDQLLAQQLVLPVRFEETLIAMQHQGFTHFLEIGPGTVLSGFVKKTLPSSNVEHISAVSDLERVKGWLSTHGFNQ